MILLPDAALAATDEVARVGCSESDIQYVTFQLTGTWTGTVTFEGTLLDGASFTSVLATLLSSGVAAATATATGIYRIDATGLLQVQARFSTASSGTVVVTASLATQK